MTLISRHLLEVQCCPIPAVRYLRNRMKAHERYDDHEVLDTFVKASMTKIKESLQLCSTRKLLLFLCKHAVRTRYHLQFLKCAQQDCNHCFAKPCSSEEGSCFSAGTRWEAVHTQA